MAENLEKKHSHHDENCDCGHDHDHDENCDCGHDHDHGENCDCGHDHDHGANYIKLSFEKGVTSNCEVLGVFPYKDNDYIGLRREDNDELVFLEYVENDERITMKIIQSEELKVAVAKEYDRLLDL